jgi:hypothetical protein
LDIGDKLPPQEVVRQGEANGFDKRTVQQWIEESDSLTVPQEGKAFGELWRTHRTPKATFSPEVEAFTEWLESKQEARCKEYDDGSYQYPVEHSYSLKKAAKRSCEAKDQCRHFIENYEKFTTVIITYCIEKGASESIAEHARRYPSLSRTRWNILNRDIDTEEYSGCQLLAPGKPSNHTPNPDFTHKHEIYWVEGSHSVQDFQKLRQKFLDEVEGATADMNPLDDMISVEQHTSAEVEADPRVKRTDLDQKRGPTTGASGEVAANLPLLRARNTLREGDAEPEDWAAADARDCPDWIMVWLAHIRCNGEPEKIDTKGITRWSTFGNFSQIAESMKEKRDSESDNENENESVKVGVGDLQAQNLTQTQEQFVVEYLESDLSRDKETVANTIQNNINEFGGYTELKPILAAIQRHDPPTT